MPIRLSRDSTLRFAEVDPKRLRIELLSGLCIGKGALSGGGRDHSRRSGETEPGQLVKYYGARQERFEINQHFLPPPINALSTLAGFIYYSRFKGSRHDPADHENSPHKRGCRPLVDPLRARSLTGARFGQSRSGRNRADTGEAFTQIFDTAVSPGLVSSIPPLR